MDLSFVLEQILSWDSWIVATVQTVLFTGVGWLLVKAGGWNIAKNLRFWVAVAIACFSLLGLVGAFRSAGMHADFHVEFQGGFVASDDAGRPLLMLVLALSNRGTASVVSGWEAELVLPDGRHPVLPVEQTNRPILVHGRQGGETLYQPIHIITNRSQYPVSRGDMIRGLLVLQITRAAGPYISQSGVRLRLRFSDVYGRDYEKTEALYADGPVVDPGVLTRPGTGS